MAIGNAAIDPKQPVATGRSLPEAAFQRCPQKHAQRILLKDNNEKEFK